MQPEPAIAAPLRWRDLYREADLYKAVVRVYTKPLFQWRKALSRSTDGHTLYDLAGRGLRSLDALHRSLQQRDFRFRPAVALRYNFNGKRRTIYLAPWEDRIVDLLLYRALNRRLHPWFSPDSYAYRDRSFGLDLCQARIARVLRGAPSALFCVKRDIRDYFASVDHGLLRARLAELVDPADYLFALLGQRIAFEYRDACMLRTAHVGIPFGTAAACLFANIFLTDLDRAVARIPGVFWFRYADDLLVLAPARDAALAAADEIERTLAALRLTNKLSHSLDLVLSAAPAAKEQEADVRFAAASAFRHLGLEFRAGGEVSLSRDKARKIQNLFRFAFRRGRRRWQRLAEPDARARMLVEIALETLERGVRNVAIVDYYLRHVTDQAQLRRLDLWLAEEVLSRVFGGHRKGHFRKLSFSRLRNLGLPSLVHRRRLILNRRIESSFFIWQQQRATRAFRGTVARREQFASAFSPFPEAAAKACP